MFRKIHGGLGPAPQLAPHAKLAPIETKAKSAGSVDAMGPSTRRGIDGSFAKARSLDPVEVADTNDPLALGEKIRASHNKQRILIVTDVWRQVNGVNTTQLNFAKELASNPDFADYDLTFFTPRQTISFAAPKSIAGIKLPGVDGLRIALCSQGEVDEFCRLHDGSLYGAREQRERAFDRIHIMTEGPVGRAWKDYLLKHDIPHTSSPCTNWTEYGKKHFPMAAAKVPFVFDFLTRVAFTKFHNSSTAVVAAPAAMEEGEKLGIKPESFKPWTRGVSLEVFNPAMAAQAPDVMKSIRGPILGFVGRVSDKEKGISAGIDQALAADWPGSIVVVGGGADLEPLRKRYSGNGKVKFIGEFRGKELAGCYASFDVFMQPSVTETFGNTTLEALASGVPVAAVVHAAHKHILEGSSAGVIDDDVGVAAMEALRRKKADPKGMQRAAIDRAKDFPPSAVIRSLVDAIGMPPRARTVIWTPGKSGFKPPASR